MQSLLPKVTRNSFSGAKKEGKLLRLSQSFSSRLQLAEKLEEYGWLYRELFVR
jgi:hypothetical protein